MEQITTIKIENGELYIQGDVIVGRMVTEDNKTRWYKGDKLHREGDLPAYIERNNDGKVILEEYYRDGKWHRDGDRPATIGRNTEGVITYEGYCRDGKRHRDGDLPAYIERNDAGMVTLEWYYRDGEFHRDGDRPAVIKRNDTRFSELSFTQQNAQRRINGVVICEMYYCDGKRHRDGDLPAWITRDKDGAVTREEYWRDGVQIPAEQIREKKEKESVALIERLTRELSVDRDKIASLTAQVTALTEKINKIKAILE